jgi:hypothetical protein
VTKKDKNWKHPQTGLTLGQLERLYHLEEECSEVIKEICKIKRHGFESSDPSLPFVVTNRENLEKECRDVTLAISRLNDHNDIKFDWTDILGSLKYLWEKKKKWFHFQE